MGSEALEKCYNVHHGLLHRLRVVVVVDNNSTRDIRQKPYQVPNFGEGIVIGKPIGDPPHRTAQHCAATSTSDSSSGYGHPVLWQYAAMNRTGTTRRWRESSVPATACSGPTACGRGRCRYADSRYTNSVCVLAGNGMCPKGRPRGSSNGDTGAGDLASAMYGCRLGIVRH